MDWKLENRVFFVTGGSRGIGREIVLGLLEEGAFVGTCARNLGDLERLRDTLPERKRERLMVERCDVRDSQGLMGAVGRVRKAWGQLDGVAANAGFGTAGDVFQTTEQEWLSQYEMKVLGVTNLINAAVPYLKQSDMGRIVVMNGVTARTPDGSMAAVSAARAGLRQIARMYAKELASDRICVNVVNLGAIDTGRQRERYQRSGAAEPYGTWVLQETRRRGIPWGRFGEASEIAPAVLFLLSPLAAYVTGSEIEAAGGMGL